MSNRLRALRFALLSKLLTLRSREDCGIHNDWDAKNFQNLRTFSAPTTSNTSTSTTTTQQTECAFLNALSGEKSREALTDTPTASSVYPEVAESSATDQEGLNRSRSGQISSSVRMMTDSDMWDRKRSSSVGKAGLMKRSARTRRLAESSSSFSIREGIPEDDLNGKGVVAGFLLPSATEYRISAYETGMLFEDFLLMKDR